jgi:hypothetical protein
VRLAVRTKGRRLKLYQPWSSVVGSGEGEETQEQEILLNWLHGEERRVAEIDILR